MIRIICRLIVFPIEIRFYLRMLWGYMKAAYIRPDMRDIWINNMTEDVTEFVNEAFIFRKHVDIFNKNYKTYVFGLTGRYTDYLYQGIDGAF